MINEQVTARGLLGGRECKATDTDVMDVVLALSYRPVHFLR